MYRPLGDYDLHVLNYVAVEMAIDFVSYGARLIFPALDLSYVASIGVQLALSIAAITILA